MTIIRRGQTSVIVDVMKNKMSEKLVVFDLDETLIACDSCVEWHRFLVDRGIIDDSDFLHEDERLMALYAEGTLDMQEYIDHSMVPLSGLSSEDIDRLSEECARTRILPKAYPAAKTLLNELNQRDIKTVIISATQSFIVRQVAKLLGVNTAMGIDLVVKNGIYSSEMEGIPTFRAGKVKRLQDWLQKQDDQYDVVEFYTDSINDLPLCEYADYVNTVNPCKKLEAVAKARSWNIRNWAL